MIKGNLILTILVFALVSPLMSQNLERFNIYILKHRFDDKGRDYIESHKVFKEFKLFSGYMIDPKKKGIIDLESVERNLTKLYPLATDSGVLCINLENRLYDNLKNNNINSDEYEEAIH